MLPFPCLVSAFQISSGCDDRLCLLWPSCAWDTHRDRWARACSGGSLGSKPNSPPPEGLVRVASCHHAHHLPQRRFGCGYCRVIGVHAKRGAHAVVASWVCGAVSTSNRHAQPAGPLATLPPIPSPELQLKWVKSASLGAETACTHCSNFQG